MLRRTVLARSVLFLAVTSTLVGLTPALGSVAPIGSVGPVAEVAPARAEALRLDTRLRVLMEAALTSNQPYDLQTFGDEGAAMRWLLA